MRVRLRWVLARWLDRHFRRLCWAALVDWAEDGTRRRGLPLHSTRACRADAARCGACYCGKSRAGGPR